MKALAIGLTKPLITSIFNHPRVFKPKVVIVDYKADHALITLRLDKPIAPDKKPIRFFGLTIHKSKDVDKWMDYHNIPIGICQFITSA